MASVDYYSGIPESLGFGLPLYMSASFTTAPFLTQTIDGLISDELIVRIEKFQREVMRTKVVDGLMGPTGPTFARLYAMAPAIKEDDLFGSSSAVLGATLNTDMLKDRYQKQFSDVGVDAMIQLATRLAGDPRVSDVRWAAYMLATTKHETGHTFMPITETGGANYFKKKYDVEGNNPQNAKDHGNTEPGDGAKYCGRGFVQLTWKNNYKSLGKKLLLGDQLVDSPEKALEYDIAFDVMVYGMTNGSFTGVGLGRFINDLKCNYVNARKIINALDKAEDIAAYAEAFEVMLRVALR